MAHGGGAELDILAARNRHDEIIERSNVVHLFSDNWPVRRWTSAWVAEQKTTEPADEFFEQLETIPAENICARLTGTKLKIAIDGTAVRLGVVDGALFGSARGLVDSAKRLAAAYAEMESFTVPYLEVSG